MHSNDFKVNVSARNSESIPNIYYRSFINDAIHFRARQSGAAEI